MGKYRSEIEQVPISRFNPAFQEEKLNSSLYLSNPNLLQEKFFAGLRNPSPVSQNLRPQLLAQRTGVTFVARPGRDEYSA